MSAEAPKLPENLFFMKQMVQNSCGTMALIHAILNNLQVITLKDDSVIKNFYSKAQSLSAEERGKLLASDKAFIETHQRLAEEGQTQTPPADAVISNHFIAFVNVGDQIFELDGRKNFPISHGATTEDTFLSDAARVCKDFIARDPKEDKFTIMALAKAQ